MTRPTIIRGPLDFSSLRQTRVLVLEPNKVYAGITLSCLRSIGVTQITVAKDAADAKARLILSDHEAALVCVTSGVGALAKAVAPRVAVVAVADAFTQTFVSDAIKLGVVAFCQRPLTAAGIGQSLKQALPRARARRLEQQAQLDAQLAEPVMPP